MLRCVAAFSVGQDMLSYINELTGRASRDSEIAVRLGLTKQEPTTEIVPPDTLGLTPENHKDIAKILGISTVTTASTLMDKLNERLHAGGESRVKEANRYINKARRVNGKRTAVAARNVARRSVINNSRVAEALLTLGRETFENAVSERSSKSGVGKGSDAKQAARKQVDGASRKTHAPATRNRSAGVAA